MTNPTMAIIGGTGVENFFKESGLETKITASYKSHSKQINKTFFANEINVNGSTFLLVNRYTIGLSDGKTKFKPHEIDYKTMIVGLYQYGIKKIISISKCGSLQKEWVPGTIALPRDCIDMVHRDITLDDIGAEVADMTTPFDPSLIEAIKKTAEEEKINLGLDSVYVLSVDGSRLETPAEIDLIRKMFSGKLIVGMVVSTEAQLAKTLNMKYVALSVVTNYAAGMRGEVTKSSIEGAFEKALPKLTRLLLSIVVSVYETSR